MNPEITDYKQTLPQLNATFLILEQDIHFCKQHLQEDEVTWRRMYVRSVFAFIEAFTFYLKQWAFSNKMFEVCASFKQSTPNTPPNLPMHELTLLLDKTYRLTNHGDVEVSDARLRTIDNVLFALKSFAKIVGSQHVVEVKNQGFENLSRAIKIRDGLTHPKDIHVLNVTDEQLKHVEQAEDWVRREFAAILANVPGGVTIQEVTSPINGMSVL